MNIVFFSHYFTPEGNAPASRTYEHCQRWVKAGHNVTVITCAPNVPNGIVYEGYQNRLWPQRETVDGIQVIRVWTLIAANAGRSRRALSFISYMFSALFAFLFFVRRPDLVIATSPQFFCGWAGILAKYLRRVPCILEIRDIWPESIVTVGAMADKGIKLRILEKLERWMYLGANHIVAVGKGYKENILSKVDVADRISVITNGVDPEVFKPKPKCDSFLEKYDLNGRFVCSYVGTIGMAHGLEVVIEAAKKLKEMGRRDIVFNLVGDGARREELQGEAEAAGVLPWVRFTGRLDKSEMPTVLASSDCMLIHLKKSKLFHTVIPSKMFETMAMERPIILGVEGDAAEIVRQSGSGMEMEPGDANELVDIVTRMCEDRALYQSLSVQGRDFVTTHYTRDVLAGDFSDLMEAVVARKTFKQRKGQPSSRPELTERHGELAEESAPLRNAV